MQTNSVSLEACMKKMLELLQLIDTTCKENGIEYWLDGGTLLGAVRHGGFIPWDDDVDVCLTFKDFKKLTGLLRDKCEKHDFYICYNSVRPDTYWTEYLGDISILKDGVLPVQVDIVPMKSIENNIESIRVDKSIVNIARFFRRGKFKYPQMVLKKHKTEFLNKKIPLVQNKKIFYDFFLNEYLPQNSEKNEAYIYSYVYNDMIVQKERPYYKHSDIFPLQKITFEGHSFTAPNNLKNYLSILYGKDYIVPPPKQKRIPSIFKNVKNELPKTVIKNRMRLYYDRDNKHFIARSSKTSIGRLFYKWLSFCSLIWACIVQKEYRFIFVYVNYVLIQAVHKN